MATLTQRAPELALPPDCERGVDFLRSRARPAKMGLLFGLIGLLIGVLIVMLAPARYASTVRVWVRDAPITVDPFVSSAPRTLTIDTEAQRATSTLVLARAGIELSGDGPIVDMNVTAPPLSTVLDLEVVATSPEAAQAGASALADAYLQLRGEYLTERRDGTLATLDEQRALMSQRLVNAPSDGAAQQWQDQLSTISTAKSTVRSTTVDPGKISGKASRPTPVSKQATVPPVSGFVLGGLVGYVIGLPLVRSSRVKES